MTIVAGFKVQDGVLLCADTEHSGYGHSVQARKICRLDTDSIHAGFAYAGNSNFAKSAIWRCTRLLRAEPNCSDPLGLIADVLESEYKKQILSVPTYASDISYHYRLLIAYRQAGAEAGLYSTEGPTFTPVDRDYECIGEGESIALYLSSILYSRKSYDGLTSMQDALATIAYMMAKVKSFVPSCGGDTNFCLIRNDYRATKIARAHTEEVLVEVDTLIPILFKAASRVDITDDEAETMLKELVLKTRDIRKRGPHNKLLGRIITAIQKQEFALSDPLPEAPRYPQLSKADPSRPQPSQESPGGSGES
jgi:20S proteasome alpha/beta subunit